MKLTPNQIAALKLCLNYNDRESQLQDNMSCAGKDEFAQLYTGSPAKRLQRAGGLITGLMDKGLGQHEAADGDVGDIFWLSELGINTIFDIIEAEEAATAPAAETAPEPAQKEEAAPVVEKASKPQSFRAIVRALLESGCAYSMEELVATTNSGNSQISVILSDLKNAKYAGKAGPLNIVKIDGRYLVIK